MQTKRRRKGTSGAVIRQFGAGGGDGGGGSGGGHLHSPSSYPTALTCRGRLQ